MYALIDTTDGGHIRYTFYFGRGSYPMRLLQHLGQAAGMRLLMATNPDIKVSACWQ